jgi:MYXO-CTERM domain-containing protein
MKKTLLMIVLSAASANAAISIGGTAVTNARNALGTASVPSGSLALLIVDTANNGFFDFGTPAANSTFNSTADPKLTSAAAGLTIGSTFGGELVLNRINSGTGSVASLLTNVEVDLYLNRSFAVVWFSGLTFAGGDTTAPANSSWGVVRGSDWVFPAANTGSFTTSGTDANGAASYYQVNANVPGVGQSAFRTTLGDNTTGAAAFKVVPEPSAALLGAVGALGLLRRRRN